MKENNTDMTTKDDGYAIAGKVFKGIGIGLGVTALIGVIALAVCGWAFWQFIKFIMAATMF